LFAPSAALDAGGRVDARREDDARSRVDARGADESSHEDAPTPIADATTVDVTPDVTAEAEPVDARVPDAAPEAPAYDARFDAIADASDPGGPLQRQRWEVPCNATVQNDSRLCSSVPAGNPCSGDYRPVDKTLTFGGAPGAHYAVTLRLRGVVELKSYDGGTALGAHFQIGGAPSDGVVNVYGFSVSSPRETYYINADRGGGATVVVVDDTVTIPIDGGANIELFASDRDCVQLRNCVYPDAPVCTPYVVLGIPPAPGAFAGQFAQVDVVSVVAQP
jgi:hypothetical protein